jgi:phosphoribosyl-ATP pyrophosphohydrolase/phosphoribosyl-AMP cyclohydrolase
VSDWLNQVRFDDKGLVTAIAQDAKSQRVLMVAHMNRQALEKTLATGQAVYFSRSRQRLWHKGEESGHFQILKSIRLDCDGDVVLMQVEQVGGLACHTGRPSCFFQELTQNNDWQVVEPVHKDPALIYASNPGTALGRSQQSAVPADLGEGESEGEGVLAPKALATPELLGTVFHRLQGLLAQRAKADPSTSYVARLLQGPEDSLLKKIGEEACETVMACKDADKDRIVAETADLWFHCLVTLHRYGLGPAEVLTELQRREGLSGLDEKAARQADRRTEDSKRSRDA